MNLQVRNLLHAAWWRQALPLSAAAATLLGYLSLSLFDARQMSALAVQLVLMLAVNLIALAARAIRRDLPLAVLAALVWMLACVWFFGLTASTAVLLAVLAAMAIGSLLPRTVVPGVARLATGIAALVTLASWTLPLPIHKTWLYFVVAAVLVVWRLPAIRRQLDLQGIIQWTERHRGLALLLVNIVGICATPLWLPTMQSDDIAYHLALPYQLQDLGYYQMHIDRSIWALAPWANDVWHAIVQVLGQTEGRGAVNLVWMLVMYAGMWQLGARLALPPAPLAMALMLHASLPISSSLLAGMQTELPSSALLVVLALLISAQTRLCAPRLIAIAAVAGLLLACKLSNALFLLPMGIWLLLRSWRQLPLRSLPLAIAIGLAVALPSYFYGWVIADNPVLPFLNGVFDSPYAPPGNWSDQTWMREISPLLPWVLMFNSSDYLSTVNGAAGFTYLYIFVGLGAAAFDRRTMPLAAVALAAFALVFGQIQYVRYTHPGMTLLLLASTAGYCRLARRSGGLLLAQGLLVVLNLTMVNGGYWHLRNGALRDYLKNDEQTVLARFAPQRLVAQWLRGQDLGNGTVLFHHVDSQGNAELSASTLTTSWYTPWLARAVADAGKDPSGESWVRLLAERNITMLVIDRRMIDDSLRQALQRGAGEVVFSAGIYDVWKIDTLSQLQPQHVVTTAGYVKWHYAATEQAATFQTTLQFSCNQPGNPLVISISTRDPGGADTHRKSGWAMCTDQMLARAELASPLEAGQAATVTAMPRSPMPINPVEVQATLAPLPGPASLPPSRQLLQRWSVPGFTPDTESAP